MPIMRATVRIGEDGKLRIPSNLAKAAGVKDGCSLEISLCGGAQAPYLLIRNRKKPAGRPTRSR